VTVTAMESCPPLVSPYAPFTALQDAGDGAEDGGSVDGCEVGLFDGEDVGTEDGSEVGSAVGTIDG